MFDSLRFKPFKSKIFSTISLALIVLILIFAHSLFSNVSLHHSVANQSRRELQTHRTSEPLKSTSSTDERRIKIAEKINEVGENLVPIPQNKFSRLGLFESTHSTRKVDRIAKFFGKKHCKVQFFITWISPVESFGEREFFVLESVFKSNPGACLVILSNTMDSKDGFSILKPLIHRGYGVKAISPDLGSLFKNTPSETWLNEIKNGVKDPGEIPLAQNLSNLIRLAVLYKYGGIYIDTDFIVLKDFSDLRNAIGAQSVDIHGNWTRLNNAVMVFDKMHPLLYSFMEEFSSTFDGNKWGHNGPYLVSRVIDRVSKMQELNYSVLPPMAFYPVDWTRVAGFFARPNDRYAERWVEAKLRQLRNAAYGVHLWNRQSSGFKIEEGSIIGRLVSDLCVICRVKQSS